jgi:hypothetical protein
MCTCCGCWLVGDERSRSVTWEVLAVDATALGRFAVHVALKALAVLFEAARLLAATTLVVPRDGYCATADAASAAPRATVSGNFRPKCIRVALKSDRNSIAPCGFFRQVIRARKAITRRCAVNSSTEAVTVEFQTVRSLAIAVALGKRLVLGIPDNLGSHHVRNPRTACLRLYTCKRGQTRIKHCVLLKQ